MNTNNFSVEERFLMIQALNERIIESYEEEKLIETKTSLKKYLLPVNKTLTKLTQNDKKLSKKERSSLNGCLNVLKDKVSIEDRKILINCMRELELKKNKT